MTHNKFTRSAPSVSLTGCPAGDCPNGKVINILKGVSIVAVSLVVGALVYLNEVDIQQHDNEASIRASIVELDHVNKIQDTRIDGQKVSTKVIDGNLDRLERLINRNTDAIANNRRNITANAWQLKNVLDANGRIFKKLDTFMASNMSLSAKYQKTMSRLEVVVREIEEGRKEK